MERYRLYQVGISLLLLVAVVLLTRVLDTKWDLTPDKRYTLAPEAKKVTAQLQEEVVITSFLEGNVPASFRHFQSYIEDYLLELKRTNPLIQIIYKDVTEGSDEEKADALAYLKSHGVVPISRQVANDEEVSKNLIYPYLSIHTSSNITFVNLLERASIESTEEESLLDAVHSFESKLLRGLRRSV